MRIDVLVNLEKASIGFALSEFVTSLIAPIVLLSVRSCMDSPAGLFINCHAF